MMASTHDCQAGSWRSVALMRSHMGPVSSRSHHLDPRVHGEMDQVDREIDQHGEDRGEADESPGSAHSRP